MDDATPLYWGMHEQPPLEGDPYALARSSAPSGRIVPLPYTDLRTSAILVVQARFSGDARLNYIVGTRETVPFIKTEM